MQIKNRIVVVDDNTDILDVLELALGDAGYQTILVSRADRALGVIKKEKPDLIILDVLMSGKDGRILCGEIKSDPELADIPVLMTSAYPNAAASVKDYGADGYIAKPFGLDDFLLQVENYIGSNSKRQSK